MRSMALEFENDKNCSYLDKQYMLGDSLLVAPIFNEEGIAEYYLPEGHWTNYLTGEESEGGKWRKEEHGYCSIPLWVREKSVIPTAPKIKRAEEGFSENLEWRVYLTEGRAEGIVWDKNRAAQHLIVEKEGNKVRVQYWTENDEGGKENEANGEGAEGQGEKKIVHIRLVNGAGVETEGTEGVDQGRDKVFLI